MNAPLGTLDRPNSYIGRSVSRPNAKPALTACAKKPPARGSFWRVTPHD